MSEVFHRLSHCTNVNGLSLEHNAWKDRTVNGIFHCSASCVSVNVLLSGTDCIQRANCDRESSIFVSYLHNRFVS